MQRAILWKLGIVGLLFVSQSIHAAKLTVPDDFPNSFFMELMSGTLYIWNGPIPVNSTDISNPILFDASSFDGSAAVGAGTSELTLTSVQDWEINRATIASIEATFYIDGNGSGTFVDNGDGTGEWTLEVPLYAIWSDHRFDFPDMVLSTSASYYLSRNQIVTGQSLDYETGDTVLVGQSMILDINSALYGMPLTLELHANDPVLATPIPAAVWLFGSGLLAVFGFARRGRHFG